MNILLQVVANPVQMHLLSFYPAVLVNSKLDYCVAAAIVFRVRGIVVVVFSIVF